MRKSSLKSVASPGGLEGPWRRAQSNTTCIKVRRSVPAAAPCNSEIRPAYNDILSSFQCAKWALAEQLHEMSGHQICKAWSRRSAPMNNCCRPDLQKLYVLIGSPRQMLQALENKQWCAVNLTQIYFHEEDVNHTQQFLLLSAFTTTCT